MRTRGRTWGALAAIAITLAFSGNLTFAQEPGTGTIEGTVLNGKGEAPNHRGYYGVEVRAAGPSNKNTISEPSLGGFYSIPDLKPGIYEVFVVASTLSGPGTVYRPQRIQGVVVKPNSRAVLKIVVSEGTELEEIGKPAVATQPAIFIASELERLQRSIEELKKAVEGLKK